MGNSDKWIEGNAVTYLNGQYQLPFGYEAEGLFQSEEDIKNHAEQGNVLPGNIKLKIKMTMELLTVMTVLS